MPTAELILGGGLILAAISLLAIFRRERLARAASEMSPTHPFLARIVRGRRAHHRPVRRVRRRDDRPEYHHGPVHALIANKAVTWRKAERVHRPILPVRSGSAI